MKSIQRIPILQLLRQSSALPTGMGASFCVCHATLVSFNLFFVHHSTAACPDLLGTLSASIPHIPKNRWPSVKQGMATIRLVKPSPLLPCSRRASDQLGESGGGRIATPNIQASYTTQLAGTSLLGPFSPLPSRKKDQKKSSQLRPLPPSTDDLLLLGPPPRGAIPLEHGLRQPKRRPQRAAQGPLTQFRQHLPGSPLHPGFLAQLSGEGQELGRVPPPRRRRVCGPRAEEEGDFPELSHGLGRLGKGLGGAGT
mmetsp:Transcript_1689/g.3680  ORF Transcript_1689/g.3680 Transcript_1689/m.3680 type:complete len:254 (+) Transcript_1689:164-925(+)